MADARCIVDLGGNVSDRASSINGTPFVSKSTKNYNNVDYFYAFGQSAG